MKKLQNTRVKTIGRLIYICIEQDKYELVIHIDTIAEPMRYYYNSWEELAADWVDLQD